MKKTVCIILMALVIAAGCSRQEVDPVGKKLQKVTFAVASGPDVKTSLGAEEGGRIPFLWTRGDKIGLFLSQDGNQVADAQNIPASIVTNVLESGPGENVSYFTTELPLDTDSEYDVEIYYPYFGWAGTGNVLKRTILPLQVQKAGNVTGHLGISGAFATAGSLLVTPEEFGEDYYHKMTFTLEHRTSYVLYRLSAADAGLAGSTVRSIKLTVPDGKTISGDVSFNRTTGEFTLTGDGSNSITLDIPSGLTLSASDAADASMVVFPQELAGQTVTIEYVVQLSGGGMRTITHTKTLDAASHAFEEGAVHRFTEQIPSVAGGEWTVSDAAIDLSASGTSNSYLVQAPGSYSFDATVMGNGDKGVLRPISDTHFHTENTSISPVSAGILWQTAPGLISNVSLSGGRISFDKTDGTLGNAVIAARDGSGDILWSWHIWCSVLGDIQAYVTPYNTYFAMDRSLGATYGTTVTIKQDTYSAEQMAGFGLFYQWGRKDPFIYANTLSISGTRTFADIYDADGVQIEYKDASTHRPFDTEVTSATVGTQAYAAAHPFTFILNADPTTSSNDWYAELGSGSQPSVRGYGFWGNPDGHLYASADAPKPVKSIYDPCPPGWMVPPADFFLALTAVEYYPAGNKVRYDGQNTSWYQRQGMIRGTTGALYYANSNGYYWTSGHKSANTYAAVSMYMTGAGSSWARQNAVNKSNGFPLRCIQEL